MILLDAFHFHNTAYGPRLNAVGCGFDVLFFTSDLILHGPLLAGKSMNTTSTTIADCWYILLCSSHSNLSSSEKHTYLNYVEQVGLT